MVQDVRGGIDDGLQGRERSLKVGDEDLDADAGALPAQGFDYPGEMIRASVGKVVPCHGGDDDEPQPQALHFPGKPQRLVGVKLLRGA